LFAKAESIAKPPFSRPEAAQENGQGGGKGLVHAARWELPAEPTKTLYKSQFLTGVLMREIKSDVPGPVHVYVTRPVYDRFGQQQVLVPQHTVIIGKQEGKPGFGERRLTILIEEMHFPTGEIVELRGLMGDKSGATGVTGKVDNRWGHLIAGAGLSALLNIGTRGAFGNTTGYTPTLPQQYAADVGSNVSQSGKSIVDKSLSIAPSITAQVGAEVSITFDTNISFQRPPRVERQ
jgi:type IV secretion system protein VirB10